MNKKLRNLLIALSLVTGVICAHFSIALFPKLNSVDKRVPISTNLYLNWIYTGAFAGEALGASEYAETNGIKLTLVEGGQGRDPLKLVHDNDFGIASADEILRGIDSGANFKIIGVVNDDNPAAFVALEQSKIHSPQDFIGKRIGLLPFGSTGLIYQALLKKTGVDRRKVDEIVVSPDIRVFISGRVNDVQPIFVFDEPVTLDSLGVKYNLIIPKDYGILYKGPCYFTTTDTIKNNPQLVKAFITTLIQGWNKTAENPLSAISKLKLIAPSIDINRESDVLRRGMPYYVSKSRHTLDSDESSWSEMIDQLVTAKELKVPLSTDQFMDLTFVRQSHGSN